MTDLWALLWSKRGNWFHIERLSQTVESGQRFFDENISSDCIVIAVGKKDEIDRKADERRPLLLERDAVKRLYGTDAA